MKLELDSKEVKAVLLEYAQAKWPGMFNTVACESRYDTVPKMVFTHEDKPDEKE